MATIKFEIVAGSNTYTATKTISSEDLVLWVSAYRALYGQIASGPPDPQTGIVPMRDRTAAEVAAAMFDGLYAGMKANVKSQRMAVASKAATEAIPDIGLT